MPQQKLPATILDFISQHVRSVEQLEILLLFSRNPTATWSPKKVYETILSSELSVQRWLDELTRGGLLERISEPEVTYRCWPDESVIAQITVLAELYRTTPVRVIEAIYKREVNAAQSFADAFKIKKNQQNP